MSLIGALLREFPNRWAFYLKQLQRKQFQRIRKSSSYDYEALDEAMSMSVDRLKDAIKEFYNDLSVIEKDVKVPTQVNLNFQPLELLLILYLISTLQWKPLLDYIRKIGRS